MPDDNLASKMPHRCCTRIAIHLSKFGTFQGSRSARTLVMLPSCYSQGILQVHQLLQPPSRTFNSFEIICIITLNAPRHTCTLACDTVLQNSKRSLIGLKRRLQQQIGRLLGAWIKKAVRYRSNQLLLKW
jgi:hypothetical protein